MIPVWPDEEVGPQESGSAPGREFQFTSCFDNCSLRLQTEMQRHRWTVEEGELERDICSEWMDCRIERERESLCFA